MNQSRLSSLIEACIGTAVGFAISLALSLVVYPAFGHAFTLAQNFWITAIFTVASVARGYVIRRWFNARLHAAALHLAERLEVTDQHQQQEQAKGNLIAEVKANALPGTVGFPVAQIGATEADHDDKNKQRADNLLAHG